MCQRKRKGTKKKLNLDNIKSPQKKIETSKMLK